MSTPFIKHGETQERKVPVNKHQTVYNRKEKYCVVHGWIDSFIFPDFDAKHKKCVCQVEDCNNEHSCKGYCVRHYNRFKRYNDPLYPNQLIPRTNPDEFWEKVAKGNEKDCWLWQGGLFSTGYGQFTFYIDGRKWSAAHRIAYFLHYGVIPKGLKVCHKCDTPQCVNPFHLFLGSQADNMRDMAEKGRSLKGEKHSLSKLTETQVIQLKKLLAGGLSLTKAARMFNVNRATISDIKHGRTWAWLEVDQITWHRLHANCPKQVDTPESFDLKAA